MFAAKQCLGVLIGTIAIYSAAPASAATIFETNTSGNAAGLQGATDGDTTALPLDASDGGGNINLTTVEVNGSSGALFMNASTMGVGNEKWGNGQNWTFTLDQTISFDALDFQNNENSYSLRSVAWKDDAAASGTGWSFTSNGTIGIFSLSSGQIYDFTSAGVSDVSAGTEIGFGAFGGANGGDLLNSFTISVIPEPSSFALLGLGGLLIARRRRK